MTAEAIKEIAEMQYKITVYETAFTILAGMCQNGKDAIILEHDVPVKEWISVVYEFIHNHLEERVTINMTEKCSELKNAYEKWKEIRKGMDEVRKENNTNLI